MVIIAQQTGVVQVTEQSLAQLSNAVNAQADHGREVVEMVLRWLVENGASFIVSCVVALLLLLVGGYLIRFATYSTRKALQKTGRVNQLLESFLCSVVHKGGWILLSMIVLQRLGINIAPLVAGLGVTGFILGFAFQESLGNLAAGMMIALNQPFKVGDYIIAGGTEGSVKELNMMATSLCTGDNKRITIPNKVIWGSSITNVTAMDRRRFELAFGIDYGADICKAREVVLEVLRANPKIFQDPAPLVEVISFAESSVNMIARAWCATGDYWIVYFSMMQKVKEALDKNHLEIPFPQMVVTVKK